MAGQFENLSLLLRVLWIAEALLLYGDFSALEQAPNRQRKGTVCAGNSPGFGELPALWIDEWTGKVPEGRESAFGDLSPAIRISLNNPVNPGNRVIVPENYPPEKAAKLFPNGVKEEDFPSGKKYLRFADLPQCGNV